MPQIITATIETAFNRLLALDPETAVQLGEMEGRIICLQLDGLNIRLYLFPSADEVMILDEFDGEADTTIAGTPLALAKLGTTPDKQAEMFGGDVSITGDLKLGRKFNRVFASLDIDWEEQLSKLVGDMAARALGNLSRSLFSWNDRNQHSMKMNMGEYLQEEIHYIPSRNETEHFLKKVDQLRDDVSRFEARLSRLEASKIEDSQQDDNNNQNTTKDNP